MPPRISATPVSACSIRSTRPTSRTRSPPSSASYFRVVGKRQVYGLSARGLVIDTALPSGEEFQRFREFWIERPKAQDKQPGDLRLLDSPRATGAYRFVLRPGKDAVMDVQARVFLRDKVSNRPGAAHQHVPARAQPAVRAAQLPARAA
ncbi:glucan biosynthesis protein [Pseudomonas aeruginosa]|nr:glucan biosynthesis protein [Pseudomonas aeruginosa]